VNQLHWHVLGAGAMGCLFAEALVRANQKVTMLLRSPSVKKLITVTIETSEATRQAEIAAETADNEGIIDHLLVTTKAHDVCDAVISLRHRLDSSSQVLLLSNGMGYGEELRYSLPAVKPFFGTTTEGAYLIAPGHIRHAGRGSTRIGREGQSQAPSWFGPWCESFPYSDWVADIELVLWQKLAVNSVINPLTALHRCRNGKLNSDPELSSQTAALCSEVKGIACAAGMAPAVDDLQQQLKRVIDSTADNRSSMLQDVLAGRRTEIDYINGYLVKIADAHQLEAPLNRHVLSALKAE
jgi:2-dehydropantoate 2-reductase